MRWGRASRGLKLGGWDKKIFLVMRGKAGIGQDKTMWGEGENPIL